MKTCGHEECEDHWDMYKEKIKDIELQSISITKNAPCRTISKDDKWCDKQTVLSMSNGENVIVFFCLEHGLNFLSYFIIEQEAKRLLKKLEQSFTIAPTLPSENIKGH